MGIGNSNFPKTTKLNTMDNKETRKSKITVHCKDETIRTITCIGLYTPPMAVLLGKDLEGSNFKYALVTIL